MTRARIFRPRTAAIASLISFLAFFLCRPPICSGEWRVTPIRLDLGREAKAGAVTVVNEGDERLHVQMKASEWTQDPDGKDRYADTEDIVYFPKIMDIGKDQRRILRAGIRIPAAKSEKTYRLFIEEIPPPRKSDGVSVAIAIRFGVPIFVKPLKEEPKGAIGAVAMANGKVTVPVKNTGNVHFVIRTVAVSGENSRGEKIFSKDIDGWYLLAGASRTYEAQIPQEVCREVVKVAIDVRTDRVALSRTLEPDKTGCGP